MKRRQRTKRPRPRLTGPIHGRISALREKAELTQEQLADACGVDKTAVSHWENGVARPGLLRLNAIAKALDVTVDDLIDGERAA